MFTLTRCICLLLLVWGVCGITIHKECMPKSDWGMTWEGSYIEVTFWLPEEVIGVDLKYYDAPLWFQLQFLGKSMPDDYDRIWISPSKGVVERIRSKVKTKTNETYSEPMKAGWNTLTFSATHVIEVSLKVADSSIPLISSPLDMVLDKVEVRGSNITINCHYQSMIWQLEPGMELNVPLLKSQQEHQLSIYSNQPTRPMIYLASLVGIQLGWDGSNLADQTVYKKELQSPIPPAAEHNITVSCTEKSCDVLVGSSRKNIKSVAVSELPGSISFRGAPTDKIFVSYYHLNLNKIYGTEQASVPDEEDSSINSALIWVIVFLSVMVILAVVALILFLDRKKVQKVMKVNPPWETESLLGQSDSKDMDILKTIERNEVDAFKSLITEKNDLRRYEIEAHYLGKEKIIKCIMEKNNQSSGSIPYNNIIKDVLKRLEKGTRDVFEAAKKGYYIRSNGVRIKLENNNLPGCIIDSNGRSILHHMAKFEGDKPVWYKDDISDFLERKDYFINAIDHEGNTVLHYLVQNSKIDVPVLREMAEAFILKGADPNLKNKKGSTPIALARDGGKMDLANLLKNKKTASSTNIEDITTENFDKFVDAARRGNIKYMQQCLLKGMKQLPMSARKNPLVEAIRSNQRESVFLLLSAGAPICNRSIADLTPLEAAHNTVDLPAFYAAIMRKAFCDRLAYEEEKQGLSKGLLEIIANHKMCIREEGKEYEGIQSKQTRNIESYSKDVRKLLIEAARNGLLLTCLLLAQRDIYLHRLPEEESPFELAHLNRHHDILVALCRDVAMVPYIHESSRELPHYLKEDMYQSDVETLKSALGKCYKSRLLSGSLIINFQTYNNPLNKDTVNSKEFLYLIAKLDLVAALHKIITDDDSFNIDRVVEDFSNSAMLHVAAMNGSIRVIEYLIYKNASLINVTIGNFTAAHLAAIGGHKECFHFINSRMEVQGSSKAMVNSKCDLDLTAQDLMDKYEELCKECSLPLMTHEDALCVKNETEEDNKTFEILNRKGAQLNIKSFPDLSNIAQEKHYRDSKDAEEIREKTEAVVKKLCGMEEFLKGELLPNGPLKEGNEVLEISHIDFIYQLSDEANGSGLSKYNEECEERKSMDDESADMPQDIDACSESQEVESNAVAALTQKFAECLKQALKKYQDDSKQFVLAPPFLELIPKGVNIRWIWKMNNGNIKLLTTYIVPVVKLPNNHDYFYYDDRHEKLFVSNHAEDTQYFSNLVKEDKKAWLICRLLRKLTQPCWWSPSFKTQYYPRDWHTWAVGLEGLSETKLKTSFRDKWENKGELYGRIKNLYENTANSDRLKEYEKLFVNGVIKYLNQLASSDSHT